MGRTAAPLLRVGLVVILSFCLAESGTAVLRAQEEVQSVNRKQAEELWEKAIAAKGGRDRLHAVRNMVTTIDYEYWLEPFKRGHDLIVELTVFPDKGWTWADYRPGKLGLSVSMSNGEKNAHWLTYPDDPESPRRLPPPKDPVEKNLVTHHLNFLMETRWVKPIPLAVTDGQIGFQRVRVVRVRAEPYEASYYLDLKTYLPLRVEIYKMNQTHDRPFLVREFSDYADVDGIQMPGKVSWNPPDYPKYPHRYQFNVEYDPEMFERPPTVEGGPYAWRPKKTSSSRRPHR